VLSKKILGVIGGIGPEATFYFCSKIVKMTVAKTDQEHIKMIILNDTEIPDRTAYILNKNKKNPVIKLIEDAKLLESLNTDLIAIPCNTSCAFYKEIQDATKVEIINIINETVKALYEKNIKKVGLLATTGTVISKGYQKFCEDYKIKCLTPVNNDQEIVMKIIYEQIKKGNELNKTDFFYLVDLFKKENCDAIILGCTELSIIKGMLNLPDFFIDPIEILAEVCIKKCGNKVK